MSKAYFLISLTNKCNKACDYCIVKQWRNNPEFPDKVKCSDLIVFLSDKINSGDVVELTGGEPTLFDDLTVLLDFLKEKETYVIIRTNGCKLSEWRKNYENMIVILAKHDSTAEFIEKQKEHLLAWDRIIDGIPEELKQGHSWETPKFLPRKADENDREPTAEHPFGNAFFITADGRIRFMSCCNLFQGDIWDYKPLKFLMCSKCPFMLGAWDLIRHIIESK